MIYTLTVRNVLRIKYVVTRNIQTMGRVCVKTAVCYDTIQMVLPDHTAAHSKKTENWL